MRALLIFATKCSPEQYWAVHRVATNALLGPPLMPSASALSLPTLKGQGVPRIQIKRRYDLDWFI
jgi:hypothetical protein